MTKHPCALLSAISLACALLSACASQSPQTSEGSDASPFLIARKVVGETNDSSQRAGTLYPSDSAGYFTRLEKAREFVRNGDCLYVQVNAIAPSDSETLQAFAERMAREAADKQVRNLILDLRHSPGGNGYLTPALLRRLVHFDASPEKDELYVIIGRNTFSAAHNLIVDLDWVADPVFVGEPSGSRPNAISESGRIRLPYSQFLMSISSQLHQHSFPEDHRWWIAPDVPVSLSSKDFFSGRDPALEAINNLIANPRPR